MVDERRQSQLTVGDMARRSARRGTDSTVPHPARDQTHAHLGDEQQAPLLRPGVQMTIRHSVADGPGQLDEQAAVERLAALSLLARRLTNATWTNHRPEPEGERPRQPGTRAMSTGTG